MGRTKSIGVVLVVAMAVYSASVAAVAEPKGGGAPAFKPVQPIENMMEGQAKLYKNIKESMLDKEWKDAAQAAWILAEIANANQYQRDDSRYHKLAATMSEQSVALAKALRAKDEAGAKDLVGKIGATCGACHDAFKK